MAADHDEAVGRAPPRLLGEVDDLGDIGEIVEREADGLRLELGELAAVVVVAEDLQIEEAHVVARGPHGGGHPLEPERLEAQVELRVHQRAWMNEQHSHTGEYTAPRGLRDADLGRGQVARLLDELFDGGAVLGGEEVGEDHG